MMTVLVMKPLLTSATAAALLAVATGCGNGNTDLVTAAVAPPTAQRSLNQVNLPLEAYSLTRQQDRIVTYAVNLLALECLKRYGLTMPVHPPAKTAATGYDPAQDEDRRLHIRPDHIVSAYGYHPAPEEGGDPVNNGDDVPAEAGPVLFGDVTTHSGRQVPAHGCYGEAWRRLGGGVDGAVFDYAAQDLVNLAARNARGDARTKALQQRWSACMARHGHRYGTPADANGDPAWTRAATPSRQEIDTAVADSGCKREVGYAGAMIDVLIDHHNRVIAQNANALMAVRSGHDLVVANAGKVVAGGRIPG